MAGFRFQDVWKRIIEVGWGQNLFLWIIISAETENAVTGSSVPPPPRNVSIEINIQGIGLENALVQYHHPTSPPNPGGVIPWPPPIVFPMTGGMLGSYNAFWPDATSTVSEFGQPEEPPSDKVVVITFDTVIWPDGAPQGPQGVYANEDEANAAIAAFRDAYPGWQIISFWIIPIGQGGEAFAFTRKVWSVHAVVPLATYARNLLGHTADSPHYDFTMSVLMSDGSSVDDYFRGSVDVYIARGNLKRDTNTGNILAEPGLQLLDGDFYEFMRSSDFPMGGGPVEVAAAINWNPEAPNVTVTGP